MKQAWFSTQELLSVAGLPGTRQGLCDLARREKWNRRRRQGARGRGMEYAFDSLPAAVPQALLRREMRDGAEAEWTLEAPAAAVPASLATWIAIYRQLTPLKSGSGSSLLSCVKVLVRLSCVWDCRESKAGTSAAPTKP